MTSYVTLTWGCPRVTTQRYVLPACHTKLKTTPPAACVRSALLPAVTAGGTRPHRSKPHSGSIAGRCDLSATVAQQTAPSVPEDTDSSGGPQLQANNPGLCHDGEAQLPLHLLPICSWRKLGWRHGALLIRQFTSNTRWRCCSKMFI